MKSTKWKKMNEKTLINFKKIRKVRRYCDTFMEIITKPSVLAWLTWAN